MPRKFQLTPSRRATPATSSAKTLTLISTHALTEGDHLEDAVSDVLEISTHALTEGDSVHDGKSVARLISTHALTEGDHFF